MKAVLISVMAGIGRVKVMALEKYSAFLFECTRGAAPNNSLCWNTETLFKYPDNVSRERLSSLT